MHDTQGGGLDVGMEENKQAKYPRQQVGYGYRRRMSRCSTQGEGLDVGIKKNIGGKYPKKPNKFGMQPKKLM